jgi:hypothetical protein
MRCLDARVCVLGSALALAGCSDFCSNDVLQEASSPSGKLRAVAFSRTCGATTGFSVQVSVPDRSDSLPDKGGNALIVDRTELSSLIWLADDALVVTTTSEPRTFKKEAAVRGVRIALDQLRPNNSLERSRER